MHISDLVEGQSFKAKLKDSVMGPMNGPMLRVVYNFEADKLMVLQEDFAHCFSLDDYGDCEVIPVVVDRAYAQQGSEAARFAITINKE